MSDWWLGAASRFSMGRLCTRDDAAPAAGASVKCALRRGSCAQWLRTTKSLLRGDQGGYLVKWSMLPTLSPLDSKRLTMNELTTWLRLSVCGAAWLAAAGLHGCGGSDAGRDAPAPDDFRHAHVLASEYQQPGSVLSSASPDLYRGWGATQPQKANDVLVLDTQKTKIGRAHV